MTYVLWGFIATWFLAASPIRRSESENGAVSLVVGDDLHTIVLPDTDAAREEPAKYNVERLREENLLTSR